MDKITTERLAYRGKRVGIVANDQAPQLVDTEVFKNTSAKVEEVAGGCFCCRFPDMIGALERIVRHTNPDVLIGEPVGSCTDLSATVLQPLKQLHAAQFQLAPFSVLVDGKQVRMLDRLRQEAERESPGRFPDNVLYIYQKQLEEADAIVLNKADLLSPKEIAEVKQWLSTRFPHTPILAMSAQSGEGVNPWLDFCLQEQPAGLKITEVDYDTYAAGEAALGWLNASANLRAVDRIDWNVFVMELLITFRDSLRAHSAEIAHLKIHLAIGNNRIEGNITSNESEPSVRGQLETWQLEPILLINARVHIDPVDLRSIVEESLRVTAGNRMEVSMTTMQSFRPGRPQPTYHIQKII